MNVPHASGVRLEEVSWPEAVAIPADRVRQGAPSASTVVLESTPSHELGLWRVDAGAFDSGHPDYVEFINVLEGEGRLVDADGTVIELLPGVTVLMPVGWSGVWSVDRPLTKMYSIIRNRA